MEWEVCPQGASEMARQAIGQVRKLLVYDHHLGPIHLLMKLEAAIHEACLAVRLLDPWMICFMCSHHQVLPLFMLTFVAKSLKLSL